MGKGVVVRKHAQRSIPARERALAERLAENIKKKVDQPLKDVMTEVGYPLSQARSPARVVQTESFQVMLDRLLPEEKVLTRHDGLMMGKNPVVAGQMVKLAHQLRGRLAPESMVQNNLQVTFDGAPKSYLDLNGDDVVLDVD